MNTKKVSDADLVKNYQQGNEKCLELLILRHQTKVYGYILKSVYDKEEANDIFQETFIKVVNKLKLGHYNEDGKFLKWVLRITHNKIMDHFRDSKKMIFLRSTEDFDVFEKLDLWEENTQDKIIYKQLLQQIGNLVNHLPEDQQEIIRYRLYDDLSFKEISETLNISINTALGRMRYAILNMRKLIEKYNIELVT